MQAVKSATQETGRRVRLWLQEAGETLRAWLAAPWGMGRMLRAGEISVLVAALLLGAGLALRRWRRTARRKGRLAPVRAEAARWLGRWRGRAVDPRLQSDLARLRFGPPVPWPEAEPVFLRARRAWRDARRGVTRPRS